MEEALAEAESKYRGIFENAPIGIFQSTPEGRFLLELALRVLASEPRFCRRQLATQLVEALEKKLVPGHRFTP